MEITLKNVRLNKRLSEETNCFSADVLVDGKKAFVATNRGCGGPNDYHPHSGDDYSAIRAVSAYAKTLPPMKSRYGNLEMCIDLLIDGLLSHEIAKKEFTRLLKKPVFIEGGKVKNLTGGPYDAKAKAFIKAKYPKAKILNDLPFETALTAFKKALNY